MNIYLGDSEIQYMKRGFELLKILKTLQEKGYNFKKVYVQGTEDTCYENGDFLRDMLEIMGFSIELSAVCIEEGDIKGYDGSSFGAREEPDDEWQGTQWIINHPQIHEYLMRYENNGIDARDTDIEKLVQSITYNEYINYYSEFSFQESFLAEDYSGICILESVIDFITVETLDTLFSIIKHCEEENIKNRLLLTYGGEDGTTII